MHVAGGVHEGRCGGIAADGRLVLDTTAGRALFVSGSLTPPAEVWRGTVDILAAARWPPAGDGGSAGGPRRRSPGRRWRAAGPAAGNPSRGRMSSQAGSSPARDQSGSLSVATMPRSCTPGAVAMRPRAASVLVGSMFMSVTSQSTPREASQRHVPGPHPPVRKAGARRHHRIDDRRIDADDREARLEEPLAGAARSGAEFHRLLARRERNPKESRSPHRASARPARPCRLATVATAGG